MSLYQSQFRPYVWQRSTFFYLENAEVKFVFSLWRISQLYDWNGILMNPSRLAKLCINMAEVSWSDLTFFRLGEWNSTTYLESEGIWGAHESDFGRGCPVRFQMAKSSQMSHNIRGWLIGLPDNFDGLRCAAPGFWLNQKHHKKQKIKKKRSWIKLIHGNHY